MCDHYHISYCSIIIWPTCDVYSLSHSDGEWDFNWCDVGWLRENYDHSFMEEHVRINHFRNHYEVRQHLGCYEYAYIF